MKNKISIYIFGNSILPFDNIPFRILSDLKKRFPLIDFIVKDPNDNLEPDNDEMIIIDTIEDGDDVIILRDIDKIKQDTIYSAHDLDLGFNLKLLKKLGKIKKVLIFGIPSGLKPDFALKRLTELINENLNPVDLKEMRGA